jgi:hypothetical protein
MWLLPQLLFLCFSLMRACVLRGDVRESEISSEMGGRRVPLHEPFSVHALHMSA